MPLKKGNSREREGKFRTPLEELIARDHEVRVVDAFVDSLDLATLGFTRTEVKQYGSGTYGAVRLLKLYLYGYLNRIRSSRQLAKECERNIEVWWLLEELRPGYHTIADFRKENPKALHAAFRAYSLRLKDWELYGGQTAAVDGVKLRAQNARKNNFNQKKIDRQKDYIDNKVERYLSELEALDEREADDGGVMARQEKILADLPTQLSRWRKYDHLEAQLQGSDETQISITDPDARAMPTHHRNIEIGYNDQWQVVS